VSPRVSLSLKAARALLDGSKGLYSRDVDELRAAIAKAQRSSATRKKLRQPKESKRSAKRKETTSVREAVLKRAGGRCEVCQHGLTEFSPAEMDHFFGRGKAAQSVSSCWALCRYCHRSKTDNHPTAGYWLERFAAHCDFYGYAAEAERARSRLAYVDARSGA